MSEQMKKISGGEQDNTPINFYYQYNAPEKPHAKVKVLKAGESITGTFEHTFIDKEYQSQTHLIKTEKEGKVTIKGCTSLNSAISKIDKGTLVKIVYVGVGKKKPGKRPPFLVDVYAAAKAPVAVAEVESDDEGGDSDPMPF